MACSKGILGPDGIAQLYTHWPELDSKKVMRFTTRTTHGTKVFDRSRGVAVRGEVLNTNPVLIAPFRDGHMVLNGKHRCVIALERGCGLVYYLAQNTNDFGHCIPPRLYNDFQIPVQMYGGGEPLTSLDAIQHVFAHREEYHSRYCVPAGIVRISDHLRQLELFSSAQ